MTDTPDHSDRSTEIEDDDGLSPGAREMLNRRRFMQAGAAAAVGAAGLGASGSTAAQSATEEACDSYGEITVAEDVILINNYWGSEDAGGDPGQCCYLYDDGSFGYDFGTKQAGQDPNYPQALVGTKPWASSISGADDLPVQRDQVDELTMEYDVDVNISGGEWNLAEEWWLCDTNPLNEAETHTHEIMLVCDWGDGHDHGGVIEYGAVTDDFGNEMDYWANYQPGWDFHIYRLANPSQANEVDLTAIMDDVENRTNTSGKWVTGVELGDEYWNGASGESTFNQFDVTINGTTYTSGSGSGTGPSEPTSPSDQWTNEVTETTIEMGWDSVSNAGHYNVYRDGTQVGEPSGTTYTFENLSSGTTYTVGVEAENDAGTSATETTDVTTQEETTPESCGDAAGGTEQVDGQTVCDVDGDGDYRDVTGDGSVGQGDVAEFFGKQHRSEWKQPGMFDFSGNGEVTHGDVVELADYVALNP